MIVQDGYLREMKPESKPDLSRWPLPDSVDFFEYREVKHDGAHKIYTFLPNGCTVNGRCIGVTVMPWEPLGVAVSMARDYLDENAPMKRN